ncbi:MAG: hypothetical protein ACYSU4_16750 [Planctomycetota bacterium]|jgi:hypothetical protein
MTPLSGRTHKAPQLTIQQGLLRGKRFLDIFFGAFWRHGVPDRGKQGFCRRGLEPGVHNDRFQNVMVERVSGQAGFPTEILMFISTFMGLSYVNNAACFPVSLGARRQGAKEHSPRRAKVVCFLDIPRKVVAGRIGRLTVITISA